MATRAEIEHNIENTRENILYTVNEISDVIHKRMDIKEKIRDNPYAALAVATIAGFAFATFSSPIGRGLYRLAAKSAIAAAGAYASKQGMNFIMNKISGKSYQE